MSPGDASEMRNQLLSGTLYGELPVAGLFLVCEGLQPLSIGGVGNKSSPATCLSALLRNAHHFWPGVFGVKHVRAAALEGTTTHLCAAPVTCGLLLLSIKNLDEGSCRVNIPGGNPACLYHSFTSPRSDCICKEESPMGRLASAASRMSWLALFPSACSISRAFKQLPA